MCYCHTVGLTTALSPFKTCLVIPVWSAQRKLHLFASTELKLEKQTHQKSQCIWHHCTYSNLVTLWTAFSISLDVAHRGLTLAFQIIGKHFFSNQGGVLILKHLGTPVRYTSMLQFMASFIYQTWKIQMAVTWGQKHVFAFYIVYKHTFTSMY